MEPITLIITSFNRAHLLDRSLGRLATLTTPDEVIVIDDGGTDNTEEVCRTWSGKLNLPEITYVHNHNPGSSICSLARNIGVRMAKHELLATAEPELIFKTDVIAQYHEIEPTDSDRVISAGRVWFAPPRWEPPAPHLTIDGPMQKAGDYEPPSGGQDAIGWVAPYTALWKKSWIEEVGGWDEQFPGAWGWDDIDLLTRLRIDGHGQRIDLGIEAIHQFHGLGGDTNFINERHFFSKSFTHGQQNHICSPDCPKEEAHPRDLIANRDIEWGVLRNG